MTDLSLAPASAAARREAVGKTHSRGTAGARAGKPWTRQAPAILLALAAAAGIGLGLLGRPAALPEPNLMLLLRFMAVVKAAAVLGAAALLMWRQRSRQPVPLRPGPALAYHAGLALMALAPGLIWSLGPVAIGALSFHAGVLLFAVAALRDDAGFAGLLPAGSRRRS